MLCYLRFPGRALRASERPPAILLAFVADQIRVLPDSIDEYLAAERTRQRQAVECQERLGLRPFGRRAAAELADALLPQAIETDRLASLAEQVMQACRQRQIVVPSPAALERLCAELRDHARREAHRRLTQGLSAEQRRRLDALTQHQKETGQSWLTWLRQMPEAAKPTAMLGLIERLEHVRAIGIEPGRGHLVPQARLAQLAREAGRTHGPACRRLRATAAARDTGGHHPGPLRTSDRSGHRLVRPAGRRDVPQGRGAACARLPGRCPGHEREGPSLCARRRRADCRPR